MEKDRSAKIIAIIALFVGVVGLTIGFSTFSTTVKMSTRATVNPEGGDFSVRLSTSKDSVQAGSVNGTTSATVTGFTAEDAVLTNDKITNLKANFTAPGQSVTYTFYAYNDGEYDAFLKTVAYENVAGSEVAKVCTAGAETTDEYVQAACNAITVSVKVADDAAYTGSKSGITGHELVKGTGEAIVVTIDYADDGARADGDFEVAFGDIGLTYNSAE